MTSKLSRWNVRGVLWAGLFATVARAESSDAKKALENATVFEGPGGATFGPVAVSGAKIPEQLDAATFWKRFAELKAAAGRAKSVVIYAGLPRGPKGKVHLSAEQKKSLVLIDGEAFYPTAQTVTAELTEELRSTLFTGVREWKGVKLCGGFHADFFLRWTDASGETDAMVCFGCQEIKFFGATGDLYGDLSNDGAKKLRELLTPFWRRKNLDGKWEEIPAPPARL